MSTPQEDVAFLTATELMRLKRKYHLMSDIVQCQVCGIFLAIEVVREVASEMPEFEELRKIFAENEQRIRSQLDGFQKLLDEAFRFESGKK